MRKRCKIAFNHAAFWQGREGAGRRDRGAARSQANALGASKWGPGSRAKA